MLKIYEYFKKICSLPRVQQNPGCRCYLVLHVPNSTSSWYSATEMMQILFWKHWHPELCRYGSDDWWRIFHKIKQAAWPFICQRKCSILCEIVFYRLSHSQNHTLQTTHTPEHTLTPFPIFTANFTFPLLLKNKQQQHNNNSWAL